MFDWPSEINNHASRFPRARNYGPHERTGHKKRSPCAAEGEEKRDNTQGLEGKTCTITLYYTGPWQFS